MLYFLLNINKIKHITIDPMISALFIYRSQGNYFGDILAKQEKHLFFQQFVGVDGITVRLTIFDSFKANPTHSSENM
tara:strand:- start:10319 stop:10549 length:231 start_codon:yes stop_codon:yes gene_type:complete